MHYCLFSFIATYLLILVIPSLYWAYVGLITSFSLWILSLRTKTKASLPLLSLGATVGFSWLAYVMSSYLSLTSVLTNEPSEWQVEGEIMSLQSPYRETTFYLKIDSPEALNGALVKLSWRQPEWLLAQNQRVSLTVKLSQPRQLYNQFSFDYQRWLLGRGVHGAGYVSTKGHNHCLSSHISWRQAVLNSLISLSMDNQQWLLALVLGFRDGLSRDDWEWLQKTGTGHLVAISGLHIAMISGCIFLLLRYLLVCGALCTRQPHVNVSHLAMSITCGTVLLYVILTGANPPVIRAAIMLCLAAVCLYKGAQIGWYQYVLSLLCFFIILYPFSIFTVSLWMSLFAVGCVWFVCWRWPLGNSSRWLWTIRFQLMLSVMILPLTAELFGVVTWWSPLINLLAVPLVTLILLPWALIGVVALALSDSLGRAILHYWDRFVSFVFEISAQLDIGVPLVSQAHWLPGLFWCICFVLMVVWSLPLRLNNKSRLRWSMVMILVAVVASVTKFQVVRSSSLRMDVFDVGHGLSILLSINGRGFIYDTGARYASGFSMAGAVIIPTLRALKLDMIDFLVASHDDNDHSGGVPVLKAELGIGSIISPHNVCKKGFRRDWETAQVEAVWPDGFPRRQLIQHPLRANNNDSCVMIIRWHDVVIVLTGDIEASAEYKLVKSMTENGLKPLFASSSVHTILIAPHHGSKTSSSQAFVDFIEADYVIFSQRSEGRWKLPHQSVVKRYQTRGAETLSTGDSGQLSFEISSQGLRITRYKSTLWPVWYLNLD